MPQDDYDIENQLFPLFRTDLNNNLGAIATNNSGPTEPAITFPYMLWADTTAGLMKQRNAANDAWVEVWDLVTGGNLDAVRKDPAVGDTLNPLIPQMVDERALKFRDTGGGNFEMVMSDNDPDQQANDAAASATAAGISETNAGNSETTAATSETNASNSETAAGISETNAATSETNAALSASSGYLKNTISVSTNTTLTIANQGNEVRVDTTSGDINIILPDSTTLTEDFRVAVIKISADANVVNVLRSGSDTINGGTILIQGEQFSRKTYALDQSAGTWIIDTISPVGAIGIAQVISHTTDSQPTIASDTYADIPGFSKAITIQPGSSVLLVAMLTMSNDNNTGSFVRFARDGVKIATSSLGDLDDGTALPGGNVNATLGSLLSGVAGHITLISTPFYIDPNPTSGVPLTYSIQWRRGTAGVLHLNRNGTGLTNSDVGDYFSTFYLIELTNL